MVSETMPLSEIAHLVQSRDPIVLDVTQEVSQLLEVTEKPSGAFGTLYKATWASPSTGGQAVEAKKTISVSVKILSEKGLGPEEWSDPNIWKLTLNELQSWIRVKPHDNVLTVIGMYSNVDYNGPGLVWPCVEADLKSWLKEKEASVLSTGKRYKLIVDIAAGLEHLHSEQVDIVHGNLNVGNIYMYQERPVIAEFGLSKLVDFVGMTKLPLDRDFLKVPELKANPTASRTKQSDIYMLGLVVQHILKAGPDPKAAEQSYSEDFKYLDSHCWAADPLDRASAQQVVAKMKSFKIRHQDDFPKAGESQGM